MTETVCGVGAGCVGTDRLIEVDPYGSQIRR